MSFNVLLLSALTILMATIGFVSVTIHVVDVLYGCQ